MTSKRPAGSTLDARATSARQREASALPVGGRKHSIPLLWWVFLPNARCSPSLSYCWRYADHGRHPIQAGQFALLFAGCVVLLALNVVLLRRVLSPLITLTEVMAR